MDITLIGAGNLATQLGLALHEKGHRIVQVYSRTMKSAGTLASKIDAEAVTSPENIREGAMLYITSLKDDAVDEVLSKVSVGKGLLVHTAGSLPMDVLAKYTDDYGVIYPLQTFSRKRKVDFSQIPVFIEAAKPESCKILEELACDLSSNVIVLDSEKRRYLHLAAVYANNFVNYLYTIAGDLLQEKGLDFSCLLPLIDETARKVHDLTPAEAQTGPAIRFDENIMEKHLDLLEPHPDWASLYKVLSKGINERSNKKVK